MYFLSQTYRQFYPNTYTYQYDANGNIVLDSIGRVMKDGHLEENISKRQLLWDDENRLLAINDNGYVSSYLYNANGDRTVKLSGNNEAVYVNTIPSANETQTDRFTIYPSPYMVFANGGRYTKHIYIGSERIVSKVAIDNGYDPRTTQTAAYGNNIYVASLNNKSTALNDSIEAIYTKFQLPFNGLNNDDIIQGFQPSMMSLASTASSTDNYEEYSYYIHSDHLGSTSYVTDANGEVSQHVEYVPFGEVFIEELSSSAKLNTPYLFNGKELDEETGLYYYGARYYDPKTSLWLSTDPLELKYPNISTYTYCANNPIIAIDPNGKDWEISSYRDNDGTLNINMKVTGVLYNASNTSFDMDKLRNEIQNQIQNVYSFTGKGFKISMTANIRTAQSVDDISSTDHVFAIVDQSTLRKSTVLADADINGLRIRVGTKLAQQILNGTNIRTLAHELGHTGGLYDTNLPYNNIDIADKNTNLMTQIKGLDKGIDKNNAIRIEIPQLNSIIRSYNNRKLNQHSPISTEIDYQFSLSWPFVHKQISKKLNLK